MWPLLSVLLVNLLSPSFSSALESCPGDILNLKQVQRLSEALNADCASECDKYPKLTEAHSQKFGIFNAASTLKTVGERATQILQQSTTKPSCPEGCKIVIEPESYLQIVPTDFLEHASCPAEPKLIELSSNEASRFGVEFRQGIRVTHKSVSDSRDCTNYIEKQVDGILRGGSELGKYIESTHCPSPCSYSSEVLKRDMPTDKGCEQEARVRIWCTAPKASMSWVATTHVRPYRCEFRSSK